MGRGMASGIIAVFAAAQIGKCENTGFLAIEDCQHSVHPVAAGCQDTEFGFPGDQRIMGFLRRFHNRRFRNIRRFGHVQLIEDVPIFCKVRFACTCKRIADIPRPFPCRQVVRGKRGVSIRIEERHGILVRGVNGGQRFCREGDVPRIYLGSGKAEIFRRMELQHRTAGQPVHRAVGNGVEAVQAVGQDLSRFRQGQARGARYGYAAIQIVPGVLVPDASGTVAVQRIKARHGAGLRGIDEDGRVLDGESDGRLAFLLPQGFVQPG